MTKFFQHLTREPFIWSDPQIDWDSPQAKGTNEASLTSGKLDYQLALCWTPFIRGGVVKDLANNPIGSDGSILNTTEFTSMANTGDQIRYQGQKLRITEPGEIRAAGAGSIFGPLGDPWTFLIRTRRNQAAELTGLAEFNNGTADRYHASLWWASNATWNDFLARSWIGGGPADTPALHATSNPTWTDWHDLCLIGGRPSGGASAAILQMMVDAIDNYNNFSVSLLSSGEDHLVVGRTSTAYRSSSDVLEVRGYMGHVPRDVRESFTHEPFDLYRKSRKFFVLTATPGQLPVYTGTPSLRQVEKNSSVMASVDIDERVTLTTPLLDTTRAFVTVGYRSSTATEARRFLVRSFFDGTTTLVHERQGNSSVINLTSYTSEFTQGVTVDSGTYGGSTSTDITLTYDFDLSQSFVLLSMSSGVAGDFTNQFPLGYLWDDAGTKKLHLGPATSNGIIVWQVVQINGASVQRFSGSMTAGADTADFTLTAVDQARTFAIFYQENNGSSPNNINYRMLQGEFTSDTNYRVRRAAGDVSVDIDDIRLEIVTLPEPMTVQNFRADMTAGTSQADDTVTAVSNAIVLNSSSQVYGRTSHGSSADPQHAAATMDLTTATNVRTERGISTGSNSNFGGAVIDFKPAVANTIVVATMANARGEPR